MGAWFIPVISAAVSVIGIIVSKPRKKGWAAGSIVLLVGVAVWQANLTYSQAKTTGVLQRRAVRQLTVSTGQFLFALAQITNAASDGWVPESEDSFFSAHTAEVFCGHLNINKDALTLPPEPWWRFVGDTTIQFRGSLKEVLEVSGPYLDSELAKSATAVESSVLLIYLNRTPFGQAHLPPSFCGGGEREVVESLYQLRDLARILRGKNAGDPEQVVTEPWKLFGRPDLLGKRGRDRV
jgi:hypothetical protein